MTYSISSSASGAPFAISCHFERHPRQQVAAAQMSGFGGMISFELVGGMDAGRTLMNSLRRCALAESLGAVETMITHPATTTHRAMGPEGRAAIGLGDAVVRISVGLEGTDDLIADLDRALG